MPPYWNKERENVQFHKTLSMKLPQVINFSLTMMMKMMMMTMMIMIMTLNCLCGYYIFEIRAVHLYNRRLFRSGKITGTKNQIY